jgi:4'-phosphopantetheinyl transferase
LAAYLDVNPAEIVLVLDDHGKPRLRSPDYAWLHFNLSDSAEVVVFAVARGREVGVDVEQVHADFPVDEVARRFLSLCEQNALAASAQQDRVDFFYQLWTRKEALLKALGVGLGGAQPSTDDVGNWSLVTFDAGAGYVAAVAAEGGGAQLPTVARPLSLPSV